MKPTNTRRKRQSIMDGIMNEDMDTNTDKSENNKKDKDGKRSEEIWT